MHLLSHTRNYTHPDMNYTLHAHARMHIHTALKTFITHTQTHTRTNAHTCRNLKNTRTHTYTHRNYIHAQTYKLTNTIKCSLLFNQHLITYTYIHVHTRTRTYTHILSSTLNSLKRAGARTSTHACLHTLNRDNMHTQANYHVYIAYADKVTHTRTHVDTHTRTHEHRHSFTHARTHTQTHTRPYLKFTGINTLTHTRTNTHTSV